MRGIGAFILVAGWILCLSGLVWALNIGAIGPISGTSLVTHSELCLSEDCAKTEPVKLPFHGPMRNDSAPEIRRLVVNLPIATVPEKLQALYLPSFADAIHLRVNGNTVFGYEPDDGRPPRMWNLPVLATVPPGLLAAGDNRLEITLSGYPQEGLALEPFYFGPEDLLAPHFSWRFLTGPSIARFNIGFLTIAGLLLGIIWIARREEQTFAALAASCFFAGIICIHFGFETSGIPYRWWMLAWNVSLSIYVFLLMKFCGYYIDEDLSSYKNTSLFLIAAELAAGALVPESHVFNVLMLFKLHPAIASFVIISIFLQRRRKIDGFDFWIFFVFMSAAAAMGAYELYITTFEQPTRNQHLFQYMPLAMLCVCLWLIISRFMLSLKNYEELTGSLKKIIAEKTEELHQTYEKLGQAERLKAINKERQRIMLDLHDGIGGQLVNTLAYMQNNNAGDEVIHTALEDALRDLSLMLDSLETDASISTLLGMLRTRLEALLAENGLEFEWLIADEPELPKPGPSQNLSLLRIVQESITNIIKHAEASVISVSSDRSSITIRDNGKGFDPVSSCGKRQSHGLKGMRRRAASIGAEFYISTGNNGTVVRLVWH